MPVFTGTFDIVDGECCSPVFAIIQAVFDVSFYISMQ